MTRTTLIRTAIASALALTAAACASGGGAPAGPPLAAAPAPTPGYDWFFNAGDQDASLAWGAPESDDVKLSFSCRNGSGRLEMILVAETDARRELRLESDGLSAVYPARAEPSVLHDGDYLVAEASARDPVFQRFGQVGWIAVWEGGERYGLAPQPANSRAPAAFLNACG